MFGTLSVRHGIEDILILPEGFRGVDIPENFFIRGFDYPDTFCTGIDAGADRGIFVCSPDYISHSGGE